VQKLNEWVRGAVGKGKGTEGEEYWESVVEVENVFGDKK